MAALLLGVASWAVTFLVLLEWSVVDQEVPGYGRPIELSCHQGLWHGAAECGIDGENCLPFERQSFAFRCPSGCEAAILLEPYNVGEKEHNYRQRVIGGSNGIYRGDSSICPSALHAGLFANAKSGCGILHRTGEWDKFENATQHGIESIPFAPHFPSSFTFEVPSSEKKEAKCSDIRWPLFAFTLAVTVILSMTVTSAPAFCIPFAPHFPSSFTLGLQLLHGLLPGGHASDPPHSDFYERIYVFTGHFVPGAFVGFVLYHICVKHTLGKLDAHLEKAILWLGACWLGALNTDTFDRWIPISRLTPHDLKQQPGAITALIIIVLVLVAIFLLQAEGFRREGRLLRMLSLYCFLGLGLAILALVPHMKFRLHHDLIALLFLPGTSMQTRPSLLFQGLLSGLYTNGIARWGFGSILQTPGSMLDGGKHGTLPPVIAPPVIEHRDWVQFAFPVLPPQVDGISVLVNDVLRFRGMKTNESHAVSDFAWSRRFANETEYFRFGYVHTYPLNGFWHEDFTDPATWAANGSYLLPSKASAS